MGTTAEKLQYLNETKGMIKTAIIDKGVEITDTDTFRSYVDKIEEIPTGTSPKYGATDLDFLGDVDENGVLQLPSNSFSLDFKGVVEITIAQQLYFKFSKNKGLTSVNFPDLKYIKGGSASLGSCFRDCTNLVSVKFPQLSEISATIPFEYAFSGCTSLSIIEFPQLKSFDAGQVLAFAFQNCTALQRIDFPMLTSSSYNNPLGTTSYTYTFTGCTALTEIHFRADMQTKVESWPGYADKWGATNATIYFDL